MNKFSCSSTASNTGATRLCDNGLGPIRKVFICPANYSIATEATALLEATWKTAIRATSANRIYPMPLAVSITPEGTDDQYNDRPLAGPKLIKEGLIGFTLMLDIPKPLARKLRSFNERACSVFFADEAGNIWAWSDDNTKVKAFDVQELRIGKQTLSDGTNGTETPLKIVLKHTSQWMDYGVVIQPTWDPNMLDGLYDVDVSVVSSAAAKVVVSVLIDSFTATDPLGQVTGLVKADFAVADDTPSAETINTCTDNGDGTYDLAFSPGLGADNYTVNLVAASAISLTAYGIESTGADTFTI